MKYILSAVMIVVFLALPLTACSNIRDLSNEEYLIDLPNGLSNYQYEIIEDGVVTEAEYTQAMNDHASCVANKGFETSPITLEPNQIRMSFSILGKKQPGQSDEAFMQVLDRQQEAYDECSMEYSFYVERYYMMSKTPQGKEREQQFDKLIQCLEDLGIQGIHSEMFQYEIEEIIQDQEELTRIQGFSQCFYPASMLFYQ